MKADMDAYVNVPALLHKLQGFNASETVYAGMLVHAHGPGYEQWNQFAHGGGGYVLSRGALVAARGRLLVCLEQVATVRLETIEDMALAACLRKVTSVRHALLMLLCRLLPRSLYHLIVALIAMRVNRGPRQSE
ncbi:unnamed protein product [Prorocentrum cordatum]|uniref:N-acetylgalactosaminide beta-1,3-galactosyltransferase n=1 Tax=Prorocentrum cordatum TaxID=2364126 RepID=A0ABN9PC85_9DINO|nr:unnamed protein product [Polarella glacialis]